VTVGFVVERLNKKHDRSLFSSGVAALDRYIREQASQDVKKLVTSCFIVADEATGQIAGYYTLAAASLPATELPAHELQRLPRYPVLPAAMIGRLAVDERFQKRGLGAAMLAEAAVRAINADTVAFALLVDAKTDDAASFYRRHGFLTFVSRPATLFLPLATAKKAMLGDVGETPHGR